MNDPRTALLGRARFLSALRTALRERRGFATGKLGNSALVRLNYPILASRTEKPQILKVLEPIYIHHNLNESALFPCSVEFYLKYNEFYVEHLRNLDILGVFPDMVEKYNPLREFYKLSMPQVSYLDQEPDRSVKSDAANCYLPFFRGRKLLLVTHCGELLKERANKETFEAVWAKTGKEWFYPASVEALAFPACYGGSGDGRFSDSLEKYEAMAAEMERRDFDIAMIACSGLAIPLASKAKSLGKIGIDLGGHLQVLFGVLGRRWRRDRYWQENYINNAWIDMPDEFSPAHRNTGDQGAYW